MTDSAGGIGVLGGHLDRGGRAARPTTLTIEAGDMVGASPPESGLLYDKPTLDALDKMHIAAGTLGNHEFDHGVTNLLHQVFGGPSTAHPQARYAGLDFPVVDANVISDRTGKPQLRPFVVRRVGGVRVGIIGATTITTPGIVTTGGTDGVHFIDEASAVNKYAHRLQRRGVHALVTVIHEGGAPTPPSTPRGGRQAGGAGVLLRPRLRRRAAAARPAHPGRRGVLGLGAAGGAHVWALLRQQFQTPENRIMQVSGLHFGYQSPAPGQGTITGVFLGPAGTARRRSPTTTAPPAP